MFPLKFNNTLFRDAQLRKETIKAKDLDYQFSLIVNYINNNLRNQLQTLIGNQIIGSTHPEDVGKYLINVGDETLKLDSLKTEYIFSRSLSLDKLVKSNAGTILIAKDGILTEFTPESSNLVVMSNKNNIPSWQKITGKSIKNRAINGNKIALKSLNKELFNENILTKILNSNDLARIPDNTIEGNAVKKNSLDPSILLPKDLVLPSTLHNSQVINGCVLNSENVVSNFAKRIKSTDYSGFAYYNLCNQAIKEESISSQSISMDSLRFGGILPRNINNLLADGCIRPEHLPIEYQEKLGFR